MPRLRPTAAQTEFDSVDHLADAWEQYLNALFESNIYGRTDDDDLSAVEELKLWGRSDADLRFYNPLAMPEPAGSSAKQVNWGALPTSFDEQFGDDKQALYRFLDGAHPDRDGLVTRVQDEYCEWVVHRSGADIERVIFTSEPAAYYQFLWYDWFDVGRDQTRALLVDLYRDRCGGADVQLSDLGGPDGRYNPWNRWNNQFAVHMQQPNNSLNAEINIAARASILRQDASGRPVTNAGRLIRCGQYGEPQRQSDPTIGAAVNAFSRENRFVTLQDPVGLYMTGLDTTGWSTPDGADPQSFWAVKKGRAADDPDKAMIVRAEYSVPADKGYAVSDIKIGGMPIASGAQIAQHVGMRLGALVSDPADMPPPRAIGCLGQRPTQLLPLALETGRRIG